ncbi:MAG: Gfo/Idh/MocA family oxidoreductase [bacterium]|nr:Gfo/Idh/MocA family oxidoreductase [bacterium]
MSNGKMNRRHFLSRSAGGAVGAALAAVAAGPRRVLGANDRIAIAVIGSGGRGQYLMGEVNNLVKKQNVEMTVICDVWRVERERAAAKVKAWTGKEPRMFSRYRDVLALKDVDAVTIGTPDFQHARILADAAQAGKDAYCEKPMASNMKDARDALHAVLDNKRVVQVGTQRRSEGQFMAGAELIQSGVLGTISEIVTGWNDCNPRWARPYHDVKEEDVDWETYLMDLPKQPFDAQRFRRWHLYKDFTVGTPGLLGSHIIDIAHWYMDDYFPKSCVAHGGVYTWKDGREHADTMECLWEYPKGFLLRYQTRLGNNYPMPEAAFFGIRGTFDTSSWKATGEGGDDDKLKEEILVKPKPGVNHMENWLECLRTRKTPNADVRAGYAHSVASIMAFLAWDSGRRQIYDPEKEEIREG